MSVVPPPMSMIMLPAASVTGRPDPIAAAIGSSTRWTSLAFTRYPLSFTARRSTCVISGGTPITSRGRRIGLLPCTFRTKYISIFSAASKSAMTPSFIGRTGLMLAGVRPSISCASVPTASIDPLAMLNATMEGSLRTMPRPRAKTQVLAVPRSIATSVAKAENRLMSEGSGSNETAGRCFRSRPALVWRRGAVAASSPRISRSAHVRRQEPRICVKNCEIGARVEREAPEVALTKMKGNYGCGS